MVIPDFSWTENNKKIRLASAIDRFFSFVIDYLIFSPVVSFFLLMIMQDSVRIFRERIVASESILVLVILTLSYIVLFSLLQSVFIFFWSGSPGQTFLKLHVHPRYNQHLLFFRIFLRQLGFWFSFMLLGVPWLQVLLHPRRQTFYDRIADLEVITFKTGDNSLFKFDNEIDYWRSTYATVVLFLIVILVGFVWNQHSKVVTGFYAFKSLDKKDYFCRDLDGLEPTERLQVAIGLNLVGQLSDTCLDQEANFSLWRSREATQDLAYYAKSLTADDAQEEQDYLKLSCIDKESKMKIGCVLGNAFLTADFSKLMEHLVTDKSFLSTLIKYEFSVKHSKYQKEILAELTQISDQQMTSNKNIKKYLLTQRLDLTDSSSGRSPASDVDKNKILKDKFNEQNRLAIEQLIREL